MINQEVTQFQGGLIQVSNLGPVKFSHAIARNKMRVKHYIQERDKEINKKIDVEVINDLRKKIQETRIKLCEEHCIKDEHGNPVLEKEDGTPHYQFEDKDTFGKILNEKVKADQEIILESDNEKAKIIQEWSAKESTLDVYMIAEEHLPEAINANQIESIIWMITELVEELLGTSLKKEKGTENKPTAKSRKLTKS